MRRAPGLNARDMDRATEVVMVLWLGEPTLLALHFAELLANAGGAIPLALAYAPVGSEVKAAAQAFTLTRLRHRRLRTSRLKRIT